MMEPHRPEIKK